MMETTSSRPLAGRVALVTGASRNIGAAVAERLAREGAAVAVNYRDERDREAAEWLCARIAAGGDAASAFAADVGDEAAVEAMVARVARELGPPTILVNNAAISIAVQAPWHTLAVPGWDEVLRVNVTGAFICARAVYPHMLSAGRGAIVSMSSVTALLGRTGNLHYVTSKAALIGFTRALAREIGAENIRVNALIVGAIQTPDEDVYGTPRDLEALLFPLQSLKRRGAPADVAGAVAFLVSDDAAFITGQCVTVDGGWVMH